MNNKKSMFDPKSKVLANVDRALEHVERGYTVPVLIEMDPSNACNQGCFFCISGHIHLPESKGLPTFNRNMLSRDIMMRTCEEFVSMGVRAVNWTGGGEPTANPALKECIKYLGDNGVKMGMFTNGTLLHTFDLFDTLLEYMTWVRISIDAGNAETYNTIRRTVKGKNDWDRVFENLLILMNKRTNLSSGPLIADSKFGPDLGVGFVITPDTYKGIVEFAEKFATSDIDYVQYKPEIVNIEREGGIQREAKFWKEEVQPLLDEAKEILGKKFQINGYHFKDLEDDPKLLGRNYKKCLGSQISPCVGADGEIYVCTNHRGHKQYSYGSLYKDTFKNIWSNLQKRRQVMNVIENVECFSNCTQLCKPHESNKVLYNISQEFNSKDKKAQKEYKKDLLDFMPFVRENVIHPDFI